MKWSPVLSCCTATLLVLLLLSGEATAQDNCVPCSVDPCEDNNCNRFFNADCRPNFCTCTAEFFRGDRNVTDRCAVQTCDDRTCSSLRQCMEEVVPPGCPPERPGCRQYLRSRCILVSQERPMTCSDISCSEGMACRLRIRTEDFPPVVRCFPANRVRQCTPGTCNEGFTCVDEGASVRCVASMPSPTPSPPTSCEELNCPENLECVLSGIDDTMTPLCVPPPITTQAPESGSGSGGLSACEDVTCPENQACTITFVDGIMPICVPVIATNTTCDILNCAAVSQICREDDERGARCDLAQNCEELEPICQPPLTECVIFSDDFPIPFCAPASSCEGMECGEFERCVVVDIPDLDVQVASCIMANVGFDCEVLKCPPNRDLCLVTDVPSFNATLVRCAGEEEIAPLRMLQAQNCSSLQDFCDPEDFCVDLEQDGTTVTNFCTRLNCTPGGCPEGSTCVADPNIQVADSACIPSGVEIAFGTTCATRDEDCEELLACQDVVAFEEVEQRIRGSFCTFPAPTRSPSCDGFQCEVEGEVCFTSSVGPSQDLSFAFCADPQPFLDTLLSISFLAK